VTCPSAAAVSSAAGVTFAKLETTPPSSGFSQTSCGYSGTNRALEVGLYTADRILSSLTPSVVDQATSLSVSQVEAVAKVVLAES
jgi:hypothetical protein